MLTVCLGAGFGQKAANAGFAAGGRVLFNDALLGGFVDGLKDRGKLCLGFGDFLLRDKSPCVLEGGFELVFNSLVFSLMAKVLPQGFFGGFNNWHNSGLSLFKSKIKYC